MMWVMQKVWALALLLEVRLLKKDEMSWTVREWTDPPKHIADPEEGTRMVEETEKDGEVGVEATTCAGTEGMKVAIATEVGRENIEDIVTMMEGRTGGIRLGVGLGVTIHIGESGQGATIGGVTMIGTHGQDHVAATRLSHHDEDVIRETDRDYDRS